MEIRSSQGGRRKIKRVPHHCGINSKSRIQEEAVSKMNVYQGIKKGKGYKVPL
jgi:hypothetical protein